MTQPAFWPEAPSIDTSPCPSRRHASQADRQAACLCRHLTASGAGLLPEPKGIWRLPATVEIADSPAFRGRPAGCTCDCATGDVTGRHPSNRDTPLWASAQETIYNRSGDEAGSDEVFYGGHRGGQVHTQPEDRGNPRHGYRFVRRP